MTTVSKCLVVFAVAASLAFLGFAAVFFLHQRIPRLLQPGLAWKSMLWISVVAVGITGSIGAYLAARELIRVYFA